jgi:hypothetical protein
MSTSPKLPPLHDLIRSWDPTLEGTIRRQLDYHDRPHGRFTYGPTRSVAGLTITHALALSQIRDAVLTRGSPSGRKQNAEVVDLLWAAGDGRELSARPLTQKLFPIRRDLSIRVPADMLLIEDGKPIVLWFQPRKTIATLSQLGLGVMGAIFRMTFLVDDLSDAGLEILDFSAPAGNRRECVQYKLSDLPSVTDDQIVAVLDRLVQAHDIICGMDRDWTSRQPKRPQAPLERGLFG